MGRDKAMLELDGKTLLRRTVETLQGVSAFATQAAHVTVVGERPALEGASRAIVDRFPSCGPLGGMEAALNDLIEGKDADWAFFIPVDMPLLTSSLLDRLLAEWVPAIRAACLTEHAIDACLVEVDGKPQPLVSVVHSSLHGRVLEAIDTGMYKVLPLLKSGSVHCTSLYREDATGEEIDRLVEETVHEARSHSCSKSYPQFANVNTETDLMEVATLIGLMGSRS